MNTAVESDERQRPYLRARAQKALEKLDRSLVKIAAEGIARREINARIKPLDPSQLIIGSLEGALLLSRVQNSNARPPEHQLHLQPSPRTSVRLLISRGVAFFLKVNSVKPL